MKTVFANETGIFHSNYQKKTLKQSFNDVLSPSATLRMIYGFGGES